MRFKPLGVRTVIIGITLAVGIITGTLTIGPAIATNLSKQSYTPAPVFPRNESGQTYGSNAFANSPDQEPDLVSAVGVDGTQGYVRSEDLDGEMPKTPEEAVAHNSKLKAERKIPLYDVDGKTIIGEFKIENGKFTETPAKK
ncbi:MAG: hypothetical protein ACYC21_08085 [Eubacteriales bacterium]